MKIAMIGQKGIPAVSGGVERHVEEISRRLVKKGHRVTVYVQSCYFFSNSNNYQGINLRKIYCPNIKGLGAFIYSLLAALDSMIRDYDVVHFHSLGPCAMSIFPKLAGKKIVATIHGLDWQREKWGKFAKILLKVGENVCRYIPNQVVVVSNKLVNYFSSKYKKNVNFIPNGISHPIKKKASKIKEYGLETEKYILFLSRIVPEKGCHLLLEAFCSIKTNLKLVIAGGSGQTDSYYNKLKKYENEKIIFTGDVHGDLLRELYSNAYCYVLPSSIEGLAISLLEAMNYGLCPLISDIEENLEVVQSTEPCHFHFQSGNVNSLRELLLEMLNCPNEVKARGLNARNHVKDKYDWDLVVNQLNEIYCSLA